MNMRVAANSAAKALTAATQAVGKTVISNAKGVFNTHSLKFLNKANESSSKFLDKTSEARTAIANHILKSIENGKLFDFPSRLAAGDEKMFSTEAIKGEDSNKQPVTHQLVLKFKVLVDKSLDLLQVYLKQKDDELQPWHPSSGAAGAPPSPSEPNAQAKAQASNLPMRPPPGSGLNPIEARLGNAQPQRPKPRADTSSTRRGSVDAHRPKVGTNYQKPTVTEAEDEDQDPATKPAPQEGTPERPEPDHAQTPQSQAPDDQAVPQPRSGSKAEKPKHLTIDSVLKEAYEGRTETFKERVKKMEENAKGIGY